MKFIIKNSLGSYLERGNDMSSVWTINRGKALYLTYERAFDIVISLNFVYKYKIMFIIESI